MLGECICRLRLGHQFGYGTAHCCMDYRHLNGIATKDAHLQSRIENIFDTYLGKLFLHMEKSDFM